MIWSWAGQQKWSSFWKNGLPVLSPTICMKLPPILSKGVMSVGNSGPDSYPRYISNSKLLVIPLHFPKNWTNVCRHIRASNIQPNAAPLLHFKQPPVVSSTTPSPSQTLTPSRWFTLHKEAKLLCRFSTPKQQETLFTTTAGPIERKATTHLISVQIRSLIHTFAIHEATAPETHHVKSFHVTSIKSSTPQSKPRSVPEISWVGETRRSLRISFPANKQPLPQGTRLVQWAGRTFQLELWTRLLTKWASGLLSQK